MKGGDATANQVFRELVSIAREYVDPFFAENLIREWCKNCGTDENAVSGEELPAILLGIATDTTLLESLKPHEFSEMMKKFMRLSNRLEGLGREGMRDIVKKRQDEVT